jgi:hypothetical protein
VELYSSYLGMDFMHVSDFWAGLRRIRQRMKGKVDVKMPL